MRTEDKMMLLREAVAEQVKTAADLSKVPLAINPASTLGAIELAVSGLNASQTATATLESAQLRRRITARTDSLASVQVSDVEPYRGGAAATAPANPALTKVGPVEVAAHVHGLHGRAKSLLAAIPGLYREGLLALAIAVVLIAISVLGVAHPLIVRVMGPNGTPQAVTALDWAVVIGTAVALSIGAVNATFFRAQAVRLQPWAGVLVGLAFGLLAIRYSASAMNADFMLMLDLPEWAQTAIRAAEAIGLGVALMLVEMGAGKALAFAWVRWQQSHDRQVLAHIVAEAEGWMAERAELERTVDGTKLPIDLPGLCKEAALLVVGAVNDALVPHLGTLRRADSTASQPWAGSTHEHLDIPWLRGQVDACRRALDEFLRLAGLMPNPGQPNAPQAPQRTHAPTPDSPSH